MSEELLPESIVNEDGMMRIRWPDGLLRRFSNAFLRAHCECAQCKSLRGEQGNGQDLVPADLRVTEIHPVGAYAVQLVFSDGHRRGIFPWAYLRELYESEAASCDGHQWIRNRHAVSAIDEIAIAGGRNGARLPSLSCTLPRRSGTG